MRISYDPTADAVYIYLSKKKKSTRTEEVSGDLLVDYADKELIGIEVLNVSKKLPKSDLKAVTSLTPVYSGGSARVA